MYKPTQEQQAERLVHRHLDSNPNIEDARDASHRLHAQGPHHPFFNIAEKLVAIPAFGGTLAALEGCSRGSCQ